MNTLFRSGALTLAVAGLCGATSVMAQSAPQESMSNQVVVRDAATGQLRAATPAEANALAGSAKVAPTAAAKTAAGPQLQRLHPTGARGTRLPEEFMSHHVLVRQPDGSLVTQCVHGPEDAAKFHQQMMVSNKVAPTAAPTE